MMKHSALNRGLMFEWIETCLDAGDPCPTDAEIAERFQFGSVEAARTLLADLADRGQITIRGTGAERVITLGRTVAAYAPAPRPMPAARRPDRVVDRTVAKIVAIAGRERAEPPAPPPPPPAPAPELARKPLVRAAMVAAAVRDGIPLDAFVRLIMERGFASYEADAAAERAA